MERLFNLHDYVAVKNMNEFFSNTNNMAKLVYCEEKDVKAVED